MDMTSQGTGVSRRRFVRTTARVALAAGGAPVRAQQRQRAADRLSSTSATLEKISANLFRVQDTCNVYLIRDGARALLIDFGAGKILDYLPQLGVTQVDCILHTHFHRDQCQGDHLAVGRGIPIAVPAYEHHLFTDVENFWRNRRVFHEGYATRNDYNSLTASIPFASKLQDYQKFSWRGRDLFILPTPGHTLGSVTILAEVDGKRVAFSGDLMHSPGKVLTLHDLQFHYGEYDGVDFTAFSLAALQEQRPELLCPSHGAPLANPGTAIRETTAQLAEYYRLATGLLSGTSRNPTVDNAPFAVSPHLVSSSGTSSRFYTIISNSGKAFLVDYGFPSGDFSRAFVQATAVNDRCRFVEHNINALKSRFGVKTIDVAMATHTNDDHDCGFPYLKRHYGTKVWCLESMVEILQNPWGERSGSLLAESIQVDRSFRHGETFRWEEFEFTITHNPGHCEHQMALFVTIDGQRIGFTGDNYLSPTKPGGAMRIRPVFLDQTYSNSYQKAIRTLSEQRPDLIAPGHGNPFPLTEQMLLATITGIDQQAEFYKKLIADPDCDFGMDASWVRIYPYQIVIAAGGSVSAEIRVRNYRPTPMRMGVAFVLPAGWRTEPELLHFEAPARGTASRQFRLFAARGGVKSAPRLAIAADVTADGKHLGQIAEAVVNIES